MAQEDSVPGPGEIRRSSLPDSADGIRYECARMIRFIQEGRKDPLVIETARKVAELGAGTARQLGREVTNENRSLIQLEALHAWCRDQFEYIADPVAVELIQTPARQLRRLEFPEEMASGIWAPIRKAMAAREGRSAESLTLPRPKMCGDSDEAVIISLALAASLGIEPLKMRLGGSRGSIHYVWGAAWAAGAWQDFDILHEKFGDHAAIEPMGEIEVPFA